MGMKTPLYDAHLRLGGRMVEFAGWDLPLHYGSQLEEHRAVRAGAGIFDVSHMTVVDLRGGGARDFLRVLLANNVDRLAPGKALYSCMLNEQGGIIDDLLAYYRASGDYRLIVNAATRAKDLTWIERRAQGFEVAVKAHADLALLAVQGPRAREIAHGVLPAAARAAAEPLANFECAAADGLFISRTGYTGEDGYEIMLPAEEASALWDALVGAGARPAGLGARDTLRLEAGMALYGTDMDETTTPLESGLGWTVAWQPETRRFVGRAALARRAEDAAARKMVGLILEEGGVLRGHQKVFCGGRPAGEITSGSFSPVLGKAIALARVAHDVAERCEVEVRGRRLPARIVRPPFVRHGKACWK